MRPTKDEWALKLAQVTSTRSTCLRRAVGCVLLDARGHVLATGYNGVAKDQLHCNESRLLGGMIPLGMSDPPSFTQYQYHHPHACYEPYLKPPSGTNLDACQAIHAEQNALLQCKDVYAIDTCYVTCSPCITCVKLLLNTSCQAIRFNEVYPAPEAEMLWKKNGRLWVHHPLDAR